MSLPTKPIMLSIFAVIFCLLGLILFSDNGLMELSRLEREIDGLVKQNMLLTKENFRLHRIIQRLNSDPAYVEHIARSELGMVGTHQIIFKLSAGRKGKPPDKE